VVASAFEATTTKQTFGNAPKHILFLVGPTKFAFKMQLNSKQLSTAFFFLFTVHK
jgi:hypothetical protein